MNESWELKVAWEFAIRGLVAYELVAYKKNLVYLKDLVVCSVLFYEFYEI